MNQLYPWQQQQWRLVERYKQHDRIPHALLLYGSKDIGKRQFAQVFAEAMLCSENEDKACGRCYSCQLLRANTHPDLLILQQQADEKAIKVDEIRTLIESSSLTPLIAKRRIIIISPAEAMNIAASNSLLKILEEPAPDNHFLLVSHQQSQLGLTIRSRCQQLEFQIPDVIDSIDWLKGKHSGTKWHEILDISAGSPLAALRLYESDGFETYCQLQLNFVRLITKEESSIEVARVWSNHHETQQLLNWLYGWVLQLFKACVSQKPKYLNSLNLDSRDLLNIDRKPLAGILDAIIQTKQGVKSRNLNAQLQLENLAQKIAEVI